MFDDSNNKTRFEDEEFQRSVDYHNSQTPKVIQWVIKYSGGYIKNKNQANYVVLGFIILAIIISLFLFFGGDEEAQITPGINPETGEELPGEI